MSVDPTAGRREIELRHETPCTYLALIVVDSACRVKFSFWDTNKGDEARRFLSADRKGLRPEIEELVAKRIAERSSGFPLEPRVVLRDEERELRLSPLDGQDDEELYALIVETDRNYDSIARAAKRFQLTRRQAEVLAHVLEGESANEIAVTLSISEYTAQGYIKSLLSKTASRNRAAMVAKVLDWNQPNPTPRQASATENGLAAKLAR
jgi:DNA-binding CsgD family transcriptional regulator